MLERSTYGPWAVIAGGSEGVGESFARQLAEAGINSVLIARKPEPLRAAAEAVRAAGAEARTLELDLLDPAALDEIRAATDDLEVGLLIFNAGANTYGHEFVTGDPGRTREVIDLNITAQLALTRHFGEAMKHRRRGGILLVGSMAGFMGQAEISVYSAVKAFGRIFAEGLWLELREFDVHVLELVLGVTRTPAMQRAGLRLDLPGLDVAEPDDVAREGLEHLADGPVRIAGGNEQAARKRSEFPRADRIIAAREATRRLIGG